MCIRDSVKPQRTLPTTMEFVDIAGLVKGASKGEGLGNQFLTNIRETEAIGHVVRCFENDNIIHVSEKQNQPHDIQVGSVVVPVCAAVEADIAELDDEERDEFMQELGLEEPGLNRVIRAGYKLLNLQTYFTAGVKEVRAWTIPVGATAPQAAGKIHTDFEKGFIRAQTISFEDFITYKGEQGAKEAGKMRAEGKDYIVKDGDVMNFLFNV